jgi:RNA polymerase sigma factor (sigma-70 family)
VDQIDEFLNGGRFTLKGAAWDAEMCRLLEYAYPILKNRFWGFRRPEHELEDLLQDTMVRATKKFALFKCTTKPEFIGWCWKIAKNLLAERLRLLKAKLEVTLPSDEFDHYREAGEQSQLDPGVKIDSQRAQYVIESLDEPCRQYLIMNLLKDLSYTEIAMALNKKKEAVGAAVRKCLKEARRRFVQKKV